MATSDLREQLQSALGAAYTLERELGGGGMARVFVAEETALGRTVVVKVLPPDLAGEVSAERFRREIQLAARLRHPHIVPVLSAGAAGGLLYYTMPLVEGESLRARLAREGRLPLADALRVIRDVADSLAYAHERGVVHRDVKPENILLERGHATVTDFGVAKALAAAATSGDNSSAGTLTSTGLALGTPAYMAPEQALGDPAVDHRADLYALGVVAYEMLAGAHPFAERTPQAMIAAHLTEAPTPLGERRPDVAPALAELIARLLAKDPAARPPTAAAVLAGLDAASDDASTAGPVWRVRRRSRKWWGVVAAVVILGGVGAVAAARARSAAGERESGPPSKLVVADFEDHARDSTLARTITQALRIDLARSPRVELPSASEVREGLAAMRADSGGALTGELALTLAQRTGGKAVLSGAVHAAGRGYVITAQLVAAADGRTTATFRESAADSSQVIAAIDRLSRAVRGEVGESVASLRATPTLYVATTGSLPALAALTRMADAQQVRDWPAALEYGREAVALDPELAEAYRRLSNVLANLGIRRAEAVEAVSRAYALRARLSRYEQGSVEASYYTNALGDLRRGADRLNALAAEFPVSTMPRVGTSPLGNLSGLYQVLGEWNRGLDVIRPLVDSAGGVPHSMYVLALIGGGRLASADSVIRAMPRLGAEPSTVATFRTLLAVARRDYPGALAVVDSALGAGAAVPGRVQLLGFRRVVAACLGRFGVRAQTDAVLAREYERLGAGGPELLRMAAELAQVEAALGDADRAARRLDSALARHPLAPMAPLDRPYATLAAAWSAAGRPERAEALLAEWARAVPAENQPLDAVPVLRARILTRLAQGRAAEAEQLAREGHFGTCSACRDAYLARAFDARGAADSTLAAYERYLAAAGARTAIDPTELARAYRRLGELYEARGDVRHALQRYGDFVELWRGADAALQPAVEDVRRRIRRLQAQAG